MFTSKVAHSRDPDDFASQRKVFPCVPVKQRPLQQQSVIQVTFKHLENGLRALRKSLVCRLMRRHLLLIWSILLQQSSLYSTLESVCYGINWAHHRYGFPICDLTCDRSVLEAAKIELAKPVSIKRGALLLPR